ncbi:DUF4242 domain-containing protein [Agriterribacter sp.]|uniref:DUF4242 domain-containing protein n=1 Tax=Agriterribacter sp. TaxID=2821509 RepID=UPI002B6DA1A7|nr:DUF4242 domain-containing protein [Agriterribacter sp.]HRP56275.1 DUF4242 domain-containing protein [Agriterribacter sp.]
MPKYLIERNVPGIQQLTPRELQAMSLKSRKVMEDMQSGIHWLQSYVVNDKLFCVYVAPDKETVVEHARRGNFPVTRINEVKTIIDATSADGYFFDRH